MSHAAQRISATHPPRGGPFFLLPQIFILSRGEAPPAGPRMNFLPGKTSYAPQWACRKPTANVTVAGQLL